MQTPHAGATSLPFGAIIYIALSVAYYRCVIIMEVIISVVMLRIILNSGTMYNQSLSFR